MQTGPLMRTRKSHKLYIRGGLGSKVCPFCNIETNEPRKIHEKTAHFYRIENIFGYDTWDDHVVTDHQLVVPKRHLTSLAEMSKEEDVEYLKLIKEAETNGYNVYSRGYNGPTRSIAHLHTHLIKLDNNRPLKRLLFIRKPHLVLYK